MLNKRTWNIIHLGIGFMFVFTAFQTFGNMEKTILDSIQEEDSSFKGDGYTSLAVIYAMLALGNWVAPSIIGTLGPRLSMVIGSITYLIFIASFLYPKTWLLYGASALVGLGASIIWTGQGNYLTLNSDEFTMARNSGIFWALFQSSMLYGNFFVFMAFEGKTHIDNGTKNLVTGVLTGVCGAGVLLMLFLRPSVGNDGQAVVQRVIGPVEAFLEAIKMLGKKEMIFLSFTFTFTGVVQTFNTGVYSPSIASTLDISEDPKRLMGLSGLFLGVGEIIGGVVFGLLSSKTVRWGWSPIVLLGFVVSVATYFCIFLNLPNESPIKDTHEAAYITSNAELAILCSGLLGFADSCFNTQVYAAIGTVFADKSAPAFAIFKFIQSLAAAVAFVYSKYVGLYAQLGILLVWVVVGTGTFCITEIIVRRRQNNSDDSSQTESEESK